MELGLHDRTALVAASSAGLGFATAAALAAEGCRVVVSGRSAGRLEEATGRIPGAIPVVADVSTPDGAAGLVDEAVSALGRVDILVTNAGGPPAGTFATTDVKAYPDALALNLLSVVAMCRAAVPAMCERGWGRVLAITSISVREPIANLILSNTARAGATGFLKTLALEVASQGVTVNSIQPGLHETDRLVEVYGDTLAEQTGRIPAGFLGDPADFGRVAAFLCSESARFITGTAVPVDGGSHRGLQ
ncbi:MAG: SDR family oxidoreductase [Acidimicrobiales bacterium]